LVATCNGDVHWAERLNGLSTEWFIAARPEDKAQGMFTDATSKTPLQA